MKPDRQVSSVAPDPLAKLTQAQRGVLARLKAEWADGRAVDSLDHLCALMGLKSRGALHRHVLALVAGGHLAPLDRQRRGLWPAQVRPGQDQGEAQGEAQGRTQSDGNASAPDTWERAALPLRALRRFGRIAAGAPLDAVFEDDPVLVPDHLVPAGEAYILEVRGDSMSGDGILDGDLVIVEVNAAVRPGELAVVLVAGEGATLKRFRHEGAKVRLIPSNPAFPEQLVPAQDVLVQGRVSGLMRRYVKQGLR